MGLKCEEVTERPFITVYYMEGRIERIYLRSPIATDRVYDPLVGEHNDYRGLGAAVAEALRERPGPNERSW